MPKKNAGQSLLESAYELETPDDNEKYYDAFASTYDTDFADGMGWNYPAAIATAYEIAASGQDLPIADIGCGTGLVASALKISPDHIDGMDISPEMLRASEKKQLYRALFKVDLTASLDAIANDYGAVLSAGTFTHGHLGPEPLENLLSIARPGALFVIGVNRVHFDEKQFEPVIRDLEVRGLITDLQITEAPMYSKDGHDHSDDIALILIFRKS